jgi:hypothetical protein
MDAPAEAPMRPLRVGVLLESVRVPRWVGRVLSGLRSAEFVDLRLAVLTGEAAAQRRLWDLYVRLDRRLFRTGDDPFQPENASPAIAGIARIEAVPVPRSGSWDLDREGLEAVRAHGLDVLLDLGSRRLGGEVLDAARHGVWAHRWEGARAWPGGAPLFRACWKTADFALRRLRDLHAGGPEPLERASEEAAASQVQDRPPGAAATLRYLARVASRLARRRIEHRRTRRRWQIGVRRLASETGGATCSSRISPTPRVGE